MNVIDLTAEKPQPVQPLESKGAMVVGQGDVPILALHDAALGCVAPAFGELPPFQGEPVTGHEAVDVRSAAGDRHLSADRVGAPGDAHHRDEKPNYAHVLLGRNFGGLRIGVERIESAPSVSTKADETSACRLSRPTTHETEADER